MAIKTTILAPLLNVNEPSAQVVEVSVRDGERVEAGAVICTLETTKAAAEVTTPEAGYVRGLRLVAGGSIEPDAVICVIADSADEPLPAPSAAAPAAPAGDEVPEGVRVTKPALALARQLGVPLSALPRGAVVTEETVRGLAASASPRAAAAPSAAQAPRATIAPAHDNRILIYGGGGHARAIVDLLRAAGTFRIAGVVDERLAPGTDVLGARVLGPRASLAAAAGDGVRLAANAVGGVRNMADRVEIFRVLAEEGFAFPTLRHPRAVVEASAEVMDGAQLFALAYVGSSAVVGRGAIVNTGAILSHDCAIADFAHIAPGAILAGAVKVGSRTLVGMGVAVSLGVSIGSDARIGNNAVINADVPDGAVVAGGSVWPAKR